jgi:para-nitrobenzyl esterase
MDCRVGSTFLYSDLNSAPPAAEKLYSGSLEGRAFHFGGKRAQRCSDQARLLRAQYASEEDFKNNFLSESVLTEPASFLAAHHARRAPTFVYRFAIASDVLLEHLTAAPHGSELPYVFQTYGSAAFPTGPRDTRLGQTFAAYWIDFGKTGNPNGDGRPTWPNYTNESILIFTNTGPVPKPDPLAARLRAITAAYGNGTLTPLIRSTTASVRLAPRE